VAIALAIAADLCAALPTIAQSWSHPEFESAGTYLASGVGAGITLLTIQHWSFANAGFAAYVLALCTVIVALIAVRPLLSRRRPTRTHILTVPWRGQPPRPWPPHWPSRYTDSL
jgi:hypothetical protein